MPLKVKSGPLTPSPDSRTYWEREEKATTKVYPRRKKKSRAELPCFLSIIKELVLSQFFLRRATAAKPAMPVPKSSMVAGSGMGLLNSPRWLNFVKSKAATEYWPE